MKRETALRRVDKLLLAAGRAVRKRSPDAADKALKAADAAEKFAHKYGIAHPREWWRFERAMGMYRQAKKNREEDAREKRSKVAREYAERWYR